MNVHYVFQDGARFYLVDIYPEDGTITLKVKRDGWSDTWSLPLEQVQP